MDATFKHLDNYAAGEVNNQNLFSLWRKRFFDNTLEDGASQQV